MCRASTPFFQAKQLSKTWMAGTNPAMTWRGLCKDSSVIGATSHLENLRVALLDFLGALFDALRVLLHQLDVGKLADARLFDGLLVRRILSRPVDQDLLALPRVHPVVEQASRVR